MTETVIYAARKIITMNSYQAEASHVAVRDGRILGVGALDDLTGWGDYRLDDRFGANVPEYHPSGRRSHRRETLAVLFSRIHSFVSWGHLVCCHERDTLRRGKVHRCGHRSY